MGEGLNNAPPLGPGNPFKDRIEAVRALVEMFRFERYVYMTTNSLAVAMLLLAAGRLLLSAKADVAVLSALFGSGGLVTFSVGRTLQMWNQAIKIATGS